MFWKKVLEKHLPNIGNEQMKKLNSIAFQGMMTFTHSFVYYCPSSYQIYRKKAKTIRENMKIPIFELTVTVWWGPGAVWGWVDGCGRSGSRWAGPRGLGWRRPLAMTTSMTLHITPSSVGTRTSQVIVGYIGFQVCLSKLNFLLSHNIPKWEMCCKVTEWPQEER